MRRGVCLVGQCYMGWKYGVVRTRVRLTFKYPLDSHSEPLSSLEIRVDLCVLMSNVEAVYDGPMGQTDLFSVFFQEIPSVSLSSVVVVVDGEHRSDSCRKSIRAFVGLFLRKRPVR